MSFTVIQNSHAECENNRERVLTYLFNHGSITPLLANAEWSEMRLAARIEELRNEGWGITTWIRYSDAGQKYAEYTFTNRQLEQTTRYGLDAGPVYIGEAPMTSRHQHRNAA